MTKHLGRTHDSPFCRIVRRDRSQSVYDLGLIIIICQRLHADMTTIF